MGGLSAAIHARLEGWDVLVLEKGKVAGGKAAGIQEGNYALDPGPSIIILKHFYERVFQKAGRRMEDYLQFTKLPILSRVFFGADPPLDLPADEIECLRILKELSSNDATAFADLLNKIGKVEPLLAKTVYAHPYSDPWQLIDLDLMRFGMKFDPRKPFKKMVDNLFELPLMRAFFYGFPSYSGQTYSGNCPGAFLIPYYMLREGLYFPRGGVRSIPIAFEKLALELGVSFRFDSEVTGYQLGSDKIQSVKLQSGESISADAFISNLDYFSWQDLNETKPKSEPSFSYFTLHWGLRQSLPNLTHHNLVIPESFERGYEELYAKRRFPTEPIVYLNSTAAADPEAAPSGCSNVFAVITCPAKTDGIDWKRETPDFQERVLKTLRQAGIELDFENADFERVQTPDYFERAHGNYLGSLYGLDEKQRLWGMFPPPNRAPFAKNLAFCGGSVQPGAGLPMVVLSGEFAVREISARTTIQGTK
ncbi:phytoene desaturase family protein [soil metagenome]